MIYDVLTRNEMWETLRLILASALGLIYILLLPKLRNRIDRYKVNAINTFVTIWVAGILLSYLGAVEKNQQLHDLQNKLSGNQFEFVKGIIHVKSYKNDGLDQFTIDGRDFMRVDPHKQIPLHGCWKEFVSKLPEINGKLAKMSFINFPKWVSSPSNIHGEKLDQICILQFEVLT